MKAHIDSLHKYTDGVGYLKNVEIVYDKLTCFGEKHRGLPPFDVRCSAQKIADFIEDEMRATYEPEWGVKQELQSSVECEATSPSLQS